MRKFRLGPRLEPITATLPVPTLPLPPSPDGLTDKGFVEILASYQRIDPGPDGSLAAVLKVTVPPYDLGRYHELVAIHGIAVLDGHDEPGDEDGLINSFFPKGMVAVSGETSGSVRDLSIPSLTVDSTYRIRTVLEFEVPDPPPTGPVVALQFKANAVLETQPPAA